MTHRRYNSSAFEQSHGPFVRTIVGDSDTTLISKGSQFYNENDFPVLYWMIEMCETYGDDDKITPREIEFAWDSALAEMDGTNRIVIAETPNDLDRETINRLDGGIIHEALHSIYTERGREIDLDRIELIMDDHFEGDVNYKQKVGLLKSLWNVYEDTYIERKGIRRWKGARSKLQTVHEMVWEMERENRDEAGWGVTDYMVPYLRDRCQEAYLQSQPYDEYPDEIMYLVDDAFGDMIEQSRETESSYDTLALAMETLNRLDSIFPDPPDPPPMPGQDDGNDDQERQDDRDASSSPSEGDDDEKDDEDEDDSGSGGDDEQDEQEQEDEDGDDSGDDSESEDNDDGDEDGQAGGDEDDGGDDDRDGGDEDEQGDEENQHGPSRADDDDGDGSKQQPNGGDEDGDDGDSSQSKQENNASSQQHPTSSDGSQDDLDPSQDKDQHRDEDGRTQSRGKDENDGDDVSDHVDVSDIDPDDLSDLADRIRDTDDTSFDDDSIQKAVQKTLDDELDSNGRFDLPRPFTREYDRLQKVESDDDDLVTFKEIRADVQDHIRALKQKMMLLFQGRERTKRRHYRRQGERLSSQSVTDVVHKRKPKPFVTREKQESDNTCVEFLIDESDSMRYGSLPLARRILTTLALTVGELQIPHEVIGFSTRSDLRPTEEEFGDRWEREEQDRANDYSRFLACDYRVFREFDDPFTPQNYKSMMNTRGNAYTPLPDAIELGAKRILRRDEDQKIMIVVTDGEPYINDRSNTSQHDMFRMMDHQIETLRQEGVRVLFVGINKDYVERFGDASVILHDGYGGDSDEEIVQKMTRFLHDQIQAVRQDDSRR